jgi:hypothetical protein
MALGELGFLRVCRGEKAALLGLYRRGRRRLLRGATRRADGMTKSDSARGSSGSVWIRARVVAGRGGDDRADGRAPLAATRARGGLGWKQMALGWAAERKRASQWHLYVLEWRQYVRPTEDACNYRSTVNPVHLHRLGMFFALIAVRTKVLK